jgi:hypothetical protein
MDRAAWNTRAEGETFAVPLAEAPEAARFLRLKRLDTGESLIVPITRHHLRLSVRKDENPDAPIRWCGTNEPHFGSRHLGIAETPFVVGSSPEMHGAVIIQVEFVDGYSGSGFGHLGYGDESIQHFAWRGRPIAPTPFEIAVTTADLRPAP